MILKTPLPRQVVRPYIVTVEQTSSLFVTLQEAKDYTRIDGTMEDNIVEILIDGALEDFEKHTGKLLFQREVFAKYKTEEYENNLWLPWLPVIDIINVEKNGDEVDFELREYGIELDAFGEIDVTYVAGLTDGDVPAQAKLGALKWIASNYDDRENVVIGQSVANMPNGTSKHWNKYKTFRT